jgi:MtN3 and saliva related transmembrane protein
MTECLGYVAAACTTFAFIPQAIRVWRTRSAEDVSLVMYLILIVGVCLWIAYGVRVHSMPLIAANIVTLGLALAILVGKQRARK